MFGLHCTRKSRLTEFSSNEAKVTRMVVRIFEGNSYARAFTIYRKSLDYFSAQGNSKRYPDYLLTARSDLNINF